MFDQLRAFHRPTSVATALRLSESERRAGGRGTFVAGGTDVVVAGDRSLRWIVDLTKLPLRYVKRRGRGLAIGATSTFADLEASAAVRRLADGIVAEAREHPERGSSARYDHTLAFIRAYRKCAAAVSSHDLRGICRRRGWALSRYYLARSRAEGKGIRAVWRLARVWAATPGSAGYTIRS